MYIKSFQKCLYVIIRIAHAFRLRLGVFEPMDNFSNIHSLITIINTFCLLKKINSFPKNN